MTFLYHIAQERLTTNFQDHVTLKIWLLSFPYLKLLDYYVWGIVEKKTNRWCQNNKNSLEVIIVKAMNENHLIQVYSHFRVCAQIWGQFYEIIFFVFLEYFSFILNIVTLYWQIYLSGVIICVKLLMQSKNRHESFWRCHKTLV